VIRRWIARRQRARSRLAAASCVLVASRRHAGQMPLLSPTRTPQCGQSTTASLAFIAARRYRGPTMSARWTRGRAPRQSSAPMSPPRILAERKGPALLVTLNAPERRNAIDQQMVDELHALLDAHAGDETLAALVITGAGDKAFAAGADIAQLRERTSADARKAINSRIFNRIEEFPAPVIAAVRGFALGGGCELAIACDLRVLGTSAKMGQPEVRLGIIPAAGGTYRLPRLIGLGRARELIYTGRIVDAQECLRLGLANEVVADD